MVRKGLCRPCSGSAAHPRGPGCASSSGSACLCPSRCGRAGCRQPGEPLEASGEEPRPTALTVHAAWGAHQREVLGSAVLWVTHLALGTCTAPTATCTSPLGAAACLLPGTGCSSFSPFLGLPVLSRLSSPNLAAFLSPHLSPISPSVPSFRFHFCVAFLYWVGIGCGAFALATSPRPSLIF